MEKKSIITIVFTILFFAISTALDHDDVTLPTQQQQHEQKTTQVFDLKTMDPPRMIINRHFYENTRFPLRFSNRHPCKNKFKKMFMIHENNDQNNYNKKRVVSYGNDMILSDLTTTRFDVEKFPTKRFEFKRMYGHRHHHHHEKEEEFAEKKKERKGGLMRGFRKFLKHTFD